MKKWMGLLCALLAVVLLAACSGAQATSLAEELLEEALAEGGVSAGQSGSQEESKSESQSQWTPDEEGEYTGKEDVALYIHTYGKLPPNFITKREAEALGWPGGSLEEYAPGKSIGGDHFGNYEGLLPTAPHRQYHECDIDTKGAHSRGAKRIIYSSDGLIYYTDDHYETFTLLYG